MNVLRKKDRERNESQGAKNAGQGGFFDLAPEDVEVHKTPGPVVARRKPVDLKPPLGVLCFLRGSRDCIKPNVCKENNTSPS